MIDSTRPMPDAAAPDTRSDGRVNPYAAGLAVLAGFAWVLAFMLWIVLAQVSDYETYDLDTAAALKTWCYLLIGIGSFAAVGAAVIAGVRHELRRSSSWRG